MAFSEIMKRYENTRAHGRMKEQASPCAVIPNGRSERMDGEAERVERVERLERVGGPNELND